MRRYGTILAVVLTLLSPFLAYQYYNFHFFNLYAPGIYPLQHQTNVFIEKEVKKDYQNSILNLPYDANKNIKPIPIPTEPIHNPQYLPL